MTVTSRQSPNYQKNVQGSSCSWGNGGNKGMRPFPTKGKPSHHHLPGPRHHGPPVLRNKSFLLSRFGARMPPPSCQAGLWIPPLTCWFHTSPLFTLNLAYSTGSFLGCINLELILPQPYGHTSYHHHLLSSLQPERKLLTFMVYFYSSFHCNLASVPTIPPEHLSCSSSVTLTAKPRGHLAAFILHSLPVAFLVDLNYLWTILSSSYFHQIDISCFLILWLLLGHETPISPAFGVARTPGMAGYRSQPPNVFTSCAAQTLPLSVCAGHDKARKHGPRVPSSVPSPLGTHTLA